MKIGRSPKWQHEDPKVRLTALTDPLLEQMTIATLANADPDLSVRVAAIARLDDVAQLLEFSTQRAPEGIAEAAVSRLAGIYSAANQLPEQALPKTLLMAIACSAESTDLRLASVGRIDAEADLLALLAADNHSKVWQQCARQLTQASALEQVYKDFLSRDKSVVHIVKDKLQQQQDSRQAAEQRMHLCQTTAAALISIANSEFIGDYTRRFKHLQSQWQMIIDEGLPVDFSPALQTEAVAAMARSQGLIEAHQAQQAEQHLAAQQVVEALESLAADLATTPARLEELQASLQAAEAQWPAALDAEDPLASRYHQTLPTLQALATAFSHYQALTGLAAGTAIATLTAAAANIQWPEGFAQPADLAEKLSQLAASSAAEQQLQARHAADLTALDKQLGELATQLEGGHLKPATRLHGTINKKLETLKKAGVSPSAISERVEQQVQSEAKLVELRDWQGFATNPKRQELCETMEHLRDDAGIAPEEKAKAIKEMQEQWKTLGSSDSREGQKLWSRFKRASDAAYEPCAAFFKQQRATRELNLKNKLSICDSLELFEKDNNWDSADWKAVNDIISKAQNQWRDYNDIPRHKYKKLQQRFMDIIAILRARISAEQERNHELKRALILHIETLMANEAPAAELVEATKRAQREWQQIGISERRVDQKLWKQFRTQCDAVFERRDAAVTETKQVVNAARQEAQQICGQMQQAIREDTIDRAQIKQLQADFRQINLDRSDTKVRKDFDNLCKQANQTIKARGATLVKAAVAELRRRAHLCQQLEQPGSDQQTVLDQWDNDIELPADWQKRIDARRAQAQSPAQAQGPALAENLEQAEMLCVRLEILAGVDSPPSAQQRRMQYQVARLNKELSQGLKETRTPDEQLREIQIDWYCLGSLPGDAAELYQRFSQAEARLGFA
jgi:exonuclease SbcC